MEKGTENKDDSDKPSSSHSRKNVPMPPPAGQKDGSMPPPGRNMGPGGKSKSMEKGTENKDHSDKASPSDSHKVEPMPAPPEREGGSRPLSEFLQDLLSKYDIKTLFRIGGSIILYLLTGRLGFIEGLDDLIENPRQQIRDEGLAELPRKGSRHAITHPEPCKSLHGLALLVPEEISAGNAGTLHPERTVSSVLTRKCSLNTYQSLVQHRPEKAMESSFSSMLQHSGQALVQVYAIYTKNPHVKTISVYDGRCGKIFYKSRDHEKEFKSFNEKKEQWVSSGEDPSDFMHELLVSGPDCTMSAKPGFIIEVDVNAETVFDLYWNWEDAHDVDKLMIQRIATKQGEVHVVCAALTDAVQASIEVLISLPEHIFKKVEILGELDLRVDGFIVGSRVFQNDVLHGVHSTPKIKSKQMSEEKESMVTFELALLRNIIAIPLGCSLHLTGRLLLLGETNTSFLVDCHIDLKDKKCVKSCFLSGLTPVEHHAAICISMSAPF